MSLGIGLAISLLGAALVTWLLTARWRRSLTELTHMAMEVSHGHYGRRVLESGSGTELDTLATAFNKMAERLANVEANRRRLLSDLAHELRTPIATLGAYHDGVTELSDATRAVLSEQTGRLTRLADDINEVSTAEEGRLDLTVTTASVSEIVTVVAVALRERFTAKGVGLEVGTLAAAWVQADRQRLGQVLTNLLTNALRHTPDGGTVEISATLAGREVVISVTDSGEGIPAEHLPHVFERFFRGDSARDRDTAGSGIGLTISRAIVDAHGGSLTAASHGPGHGSRFDVRLPITAM